MLCLHVGNQAVKTRNPKKRVSQVVVQKRQRLREKEKREADLPGLPASGGESAEPDARAASADYC